MREIKFRFWDGTKGNMAMCYQDESGYFKYSSGFTLPFHQAWVEANATEGYDKPKALMQYTGLKDKDGKEIYEGDIVKDSEGWEIGLCEWEHENARFVIGGTSLTAHFKYAFWEVIGNIYENEELLNGTAR